MRNTWGRVLVGILTILPAIALLAAQQSGGNGAKSAVLVRAPEDPAQFVKQPKVAVVVGESDYDIALNFHPLKFAATDAEELAELLREDGYTIVGECPPDKVQTANGSNGCALTGPLANYSKVKLALQEAVRIVKDGQGTLLFYFSGHGVQKGDTGKQYMVLYGGDYSDLDRASLKVEELNKIIEGTSARRILLIDACRSGEEEITAAQKSQAGDNEAFRDMAAATGTRIMNSTRWPFSSWEDPELGHGRFSYYLLKGLKGGATEDNGLITFDSLFRFVKGGVDREAAKHPGQPQQVHQGGDYDNNFYIAGNWKLGPIPPVPSQRSSIAVLGFKKIGRNPDQDGLSAELTIWLTTELSAGDKLRVFAEETVARAKADLALQDSSGYAKDTLARIYKILDSDYVVSGSFTPLGDPSGSTLRIDFRMQNAATGEMAGETYETGKPAELPELMTSAANKLRAKLGISPPSAAEATAARAALPSELGAARLYAEGLARLRVYDLLAARDKLERAVASDPNFALAHLALARSWQELGYDAKATQEAKKAMDLSTGLSIQASSMVKASYSQMAEKWDEAIKIYSALITLFPDEIDYALTLARVQTDAGKPQDSLATIGALRAGSDRAGGDPRVDLQEANSAEALSDFKRQHAAAARAVQKASAEGARLLAAEANWQDCAALVSLGDLKNAETACHQANQLSDVAGGQKIRARGLTVLAHIQEKQGSASEAMELRQQALTLARQIGSQKDIAGALLNIGELQSTQNQIEAAAKCYVEGLAIAGESGDKEHIAKLQIALAGLRYTEGDYDAARELYKSSLTIALGIGAKQEQVLASQGLGLILFQLGELPGAREHFERSLSIARETGSDADRAYSLSKLADILLSQADIPNARKAYEEALTLSTKLGDQHDIAANRLSLANLALEDGRSQDAEVLADQAAEEFQKEKDRDAEADARDTIARLMLARGKQAEAIAEIDAAMQLSPEERSTRLSLAVTTARLNARRGRAAEARQSLQSGLAEASRLKLAGLQFEIRLAQAEIEGITDPVSARAQQRTLDGDARRAGYLLIAAKAVRLQH